MNHKVDELLVGISKQIQLNPQRKQQQLQQQQQQQTTKPSKPKSLFSKLFSKKQTTIYTSCDNLMEL